MLELSPQHLLLPGNTRQRQKHVSVAAALTTLWLHRRRIFPALDEPPPHAERGSDRADPTPTVPSSSALHPQSGVTAPRVPATLPCMENEQLCCCCTFCGRSDPFTKDSKILFSPGRGTCPKRSAGSCCSKSSTCHWQQPPHANRTRARDCAYTPGRFSVVSPHTAQQHTHPLQGLDRATTLRGDICRGAVLHVTALERREVGTMVDGAAEL